MNDVIQSPFSRRLITSRLLTPDQLAEARAAAGDDDHELALYLVRTGLLSPFQARQVRAGQTIFHVDKYVIVDIIGRGGNSIVFKARHQHMAQRYFALKTLDTTSLHHTDAALARFRREIDIVARLDHPNIVRAHDVVQTRKHLYLVLEYVEGCDLGTLVKERGPLPVTEAVHYAVQAARALAYAHGRGVVHRDVKPANLLRTADGVVKLTDLGLARFRHREPDPEMTIRGLCLGTPEFMAPEQAEDASKADARSDLFSLGATLFHLLTAQLPVTGSTYLHCLKQLLTTPPRPLADARPDVPEELAVVVDRLRERDPALRPASAAEAITLLEPFARKPVLDDPQTWDGRRKAGLVLTVLRGQATVADVCTRHGLTVEEFERWQQRFLEGAEQALEPGEEGKVFQETPRDLHEKIGTQAMEIERLKKRLETLTTRIHGLVG
jgi:eukaryotic-like serine/threonine-protein kinase